MKIKTIIRATVFLALTVGSYADFVINLEIDSSMDESYRDAFNEAASFWESQIIGYRAPEVWGLNGVTISASVLEIDGEYGILGQATFTEFNGGLMTLSGDSSATYVGYATRGFMQFDSADVDMMLDNGMWVSTIKHEMAHVLGFGGGWGYEYAGITYNDFYVDGSGEYTGAAALAAYQDEFDSGATFVPVELEGEGGTANGHWNENVSGQGLTGITDTMGRDLSDELMTGWIGAEGDFVSQTTIAQFYDMGYEVIPEPAAILLLMLGGGTILAMRRWLVL